MKTSRKVHIYLHSLLCPPDNVLLCKSNANSVPIIYNFHVTLLLVNVMFPSEFASNLVNLASKPNGFE